MTLDQRITQALAHLKVAWANSDTRDERTWQAELDRLLDARDRANDHASV